MPNLLDHGTGLQNDGSAVAAHQSRQRARHRVASRCANGASSPNAPHHVTRRCQPPPPARAWCPSWGRAQAPAARGCTAARSTAGGPGGRAQDGWLGGGLPPRGAACGVPLPRAPAHGADAAASSQPHAPDPAKRPPALRPETTAVWDMSPDARPGRPPSPCPSSTLLPSTCANTGSFSSGGGACPKIISQLRSFGRGGSRCVCLCAQGTGGRGSGCVRRARGGEVHACARTPEPVRADRQLPSSWVPTSKFGCMVNGSPNSSLK